MDKVYIEGVNSFGYEYSFWVYPQQYPPYLQPFSPTQRSFNDEMDLYLISTPIEERTIIPMPIYLDHYDIYDTLRERNTEELRIRYE